VDSVTSDSALGNIAVRMDRVGDLWMIRQFSAKGSAGSSADRLPNDLPNGLTNHPPLHRPDGSSESQAERQRLVRLVQQASEPVPTVTHDAAFDIAICGAALDAANRVRS
jgi:hypothetical protein